MLPFSLGSAVFSVIAGLITTRTKDYRIVIWFSWAIFVLGYGLMTTLDSFSSTAKKEVFPLVAAIGFGALFQINLIALQAAMPLKDMATSTAAFGFIRALGGKFFAGTLIFSLHTHLHFAGTIGVAIGQVVFSSTLTPRLAKIPNVTIDTSPAALAESVLNLKDIPDEATRIAVIQAFAKSVSSIWVVCTPMVGVGFLLGDGFSKVPTCCYLTFFLCFSYLDSKIHPGPKYHTEQEPQ